MLALHEDGLLWLLLGGSIVHQARAGLQDLALKHPPCCAHKCGSRAGHY
jgi:hypothetical protein